MRSCGLKELKLDSAIESLNLRKFIYDGNFLEELVKSENLPLSLFSSDEKHGMKESKIFLCTHYPLIPVKVIDYLPTTDTYVYESHIADGLEVFELFGNIIWGEVFRFPIPYFLIKGALIHKPHFFPLTMRSILRKYYLFSVKAYLPDTSPVQEFFHTKHEISRIWVNESFGLKANGMHFFL